MDSDNGNKEVFIQRPMHYVYYIENLINGNLYIGKSMDRRSGWKEKNKRWNEHKRDARKGHTNMPIHRAMRKYGIENFKYEVLASFENEKEALNAEIFLIAHMRKTGDVLYNITDGGEGTSGKRGPRTPEQLVNAHKFPKGNTPWNKGKKLSDEIRAKISQNAAGRKISNEQRKEIKTLYATGKFTQKEIAKLYSTDQGWVSYIVRDKTGTVARSKKISLESQYPTGHPRQSPDFGKKVTLKQIEEIYNLYLTGKYSYKDIAIMFNLHQKTIGKIVRKKGSLMNIEGQV